MNVPIHQFCYTHCTHETSVFGANAGSLAGTLLGYSVRASSLPVERLAEIVADVEPLLRYELPADATSKNRQTLGARDAPGRLVYARTRGGRVVVAAVSYRTFDLARRPGSLFAHVLVSEDRETWLDPLRAAQLWRAPGWIVEDSPELPKTLPTLLFPEALQQGLPPLVDDAALRRFLADEPASGQPLVPRRWASRPAWERQRLLLGTLTLFLLSPTRPIQLIAEPDFAALLFYGVLRLASAHRASSEPPDLSLSTFEPGTPRRPPFLSAQFPFDPTASAVMATTANRVAFAIDTFADDPFAVTLDRGGQPYPWPREVPAGLADEWTSLLHPEARLLKRPASSAPTSAPSPPPPPLVAPRPGRPEPRRSDEPERSRGAPTARPDAPRAPSPFDRPAGGSVPAAVESPIAPLLRALSLDDAAEFLRRFDARLMRNHADLLRPWLPQVGALVRSQILDAERARLRPPRVTNAVALGPAGDLLLRWAWPDPRFVDRCVLGLAAHRVSENTAPEDVNLIARQVVARDRYEASAGVRLTGPDVPRDGVWMVWGQVDVGCASWFGPALVLGDAARGPGPPRRVARSASVFGSIGTWAGGLRRLLSRFSEPSEAAVRVNAVCPRCAGERVRFRASRHDWICDDCDHKWTAQRTIAPTFLSYRREGGAEIARALRAELMRRGVKTFLDVDDLRSHYYDERLLREIEAAPNFLLILSPGALDRCHDANDWLRKEILHAMKHARNIVPVLTQGFQFPAAGDVAPELKDLPRYNCVEYSHAYFAATIQKVVDFLKLT